MAAKFYIELNNGTIKKFHSCAAWHLWKELRAPDSKFELIKAPYHNYESLHQINDGLLLLDLTEEPSYFIKQGPRNPLDYC